MTELRILAAAAALALLAFAGPASAAGTSSSDDEESAFSAGQQAVEDEDWGAAIEHFTKATRDDPDDADAWNMLAYSQRKSGELTDAFANYDKALSLDPEHKDAHEYMGEAYLQSGDVLGAEEHLAALEAICPTGCEQRDELEEAIAAWKAANP